MTTQGTAAPGGGAHAGEGAQSFLSSMAEKMGMAARHASIYGEPVTSGGVTVVTVAKAQWGFGGGAGSGTGTGGRKRAAGESPGQAPGGADAQGTGEGSGGGGGVSVTPVGYIEITAEGARFHRIWDAQTVAVLAVCSGLALALVLRGVRKLVR